MNDQLFSFIDLVTAAWTRCLPHPWGPGDFTPSHTTTHCNEYVHSVANAMGYTGLLRPGASFPIPANEMFDHLQANTDKWQTVSGSAAQFAANFGMLVIAAWKNPNGHGHVSIVFPGTVGTSGNWNSNQVPRLANVGEAQFCRIGIGANWCFHEEPTYFARKETDV